MPTTLEPKELRPLLHRKLDQIPGTELEAVHKVLLKLEAERLCNEMAAGAEQDRLAGKHDSVLVDAAIREHRARHPYRRLSSLIQTSSCRPARRATAFTGFTAAAT